MLSIVSGIFMIILSFVCTWKTFVKAGEPGWKCLIPFYGNVVMFRIARVKQALFWTSFALVYVGAILGGMGLVYQNAILSITGALVAVVAVIIMVIKLLWCYIKLFEHFGLKSFWWVFVAFFLPILGFAVIAFNPYMEYDFE